MKNFKKFYYCENCDNPLEAVSPPSSEQYNQGLIHIGDGSVLLPDGIAKDSHAKYIDGYYCNYKCLLERLRVILKIDNANE